MGLLLFIGRLLLLAGLYGMAYAVARAMWQSMPSPSPAAGTRLARLTLSRAVGRVAANGADWPEGDAISLAVPVTFGRQVGNTVQVENPFVSACHTELMSDGTALWLIDRGSKNGTWVGQRRLERPVKVETGGEFSLGGTVFRFEE